MHYYQHHIGDYAAHAQRLTLMEDLAYRRMLDAYYLAERPFSGTPTDVAREIGMIDQLNAVEYVLTKFFTATEHGYSNKRCDDEIGKYNAKKEQASSAGRASAERRLNVRSTDVENNPTPVGKSATGVQPTNNHKPLTNNHKPKREKPLPAVAGRSPAGTRLPDDWIPDVLFAVGEGFTEFDARTEGEKFRDYWRSQPGARGRKADWQATWRNWIRRAGEDKRKPTTHPGSGSFVQRHTSADWRVGL